MNKNKSLRIVAMWLEGGKVQGYEMSGTRGRQLFEETKLSKLPAAIMDGTGLLWEMQKRKPCVRIFFLGVSLPNSCLGEYFGLFGILFWNPREYNWESLEYFLESLHWEYWVKSWAAWSSLLVFEEESTLQKKRFSKR